MALAFIDRTPPMYEGGDIDSKDGAVQELRRCIAHMQEIGNYLAYMREVQNYNLNQQGAISASTENGEEG